MIPTNVINLEPLKMEGNTAMKSKNIPLHIAVVPWLAYGHILPLLDLSMKLSQRGLKVTLISTPNNVSSMEKLIAEQEQQPHTNSIHFNAIELPKVEGLPEGKENTRDLEGRHQVRFLIEAVQNLKKPLKDVFCSIAPDCVVCDIFVPMAPANELGIPVVSFLVTPALSLCYTWDENPDMTEFPFSTIYEGCLLPSHGPAFYQIQSGFHALPKVCEGVICNSCKEVEGKFINRVEELTGKPAFALGPLLLTSQTQTENESEYTKACMAWMDEQPEGSVLYIAFGTECSLSNDETGEMARGLEESGVSFVWALRKFGDGDARNKLPDGFEERMRETGRGFVLGGWVPQKKLMEKGCVGCFMSHCGWNSVLQAMQFGFPFVAVPLMFEQGLSARLVTADLGLGLEVRRDSQGVIRAQEVCRCVKGVMSGEGGGAFKKKAQHMRNVFSSQILPPVDGSQARNMDNFVNFLHALPS